MKKIIPLLFVCFLFPSVGNAQSANDMICDVAVKHITNILINGDINTLEGIKTYKIAVREDFATLHSDYKGFEFLRVRGIDYAEDFYKYVQQLKPNERGSYLKSVKRNGVLRTYERIHKNCKQHIVLD